MRRPRSFPVAGLAALVSCVPYDQQSALNPAGLQAASIHRLWLFMLVTATVVYVVVMLAFVLVSRRAARDDELAQARERAATRGVTISAAVTLVILFALLVYDFAVAHALRAPASPMLTIRITGHQWWWEVEYQDSVPQNIVRLANEIHVPVGRPVVLELESHDVIHSLWIPNLAGKKDLIPGHHNALWIRADKPGVYRSQCAEFCGLQHAKMALFVVAEDESAFRDWLNTQRNPSPAMHDTLAARGRTVFESGSCALCHTVAGTAAGGRIGPDLTHLASRHSLAAGTLNNTVGNLAGWILDPQTIKPGAQMPVNALAPADLRALLAFLATLR